MKMGLRNRVSGVSYLLLAPVFGWLADRVKRWAIVGIRSLHLVGCFRCERVVAHVEPDAAHAGFSSVWERPRTGPRRRRLISDLFPIERRGAILAWFLRRYRWAARWAMCSGSYLQAHYLALGVYHHASTGGSFWACSAF